MKTNADIKNAEQQEAAPKPKKRFYCPVEATLSQIGGKYKAIILYHLFEDKVLRFHELQNTNISLIIANCVDFRTASERFCHSKVSTTMDIYSHALPKNDREAPGLIGKS